MENLPSHEDHIAARVILRATRSWVRALHPTASKQTRDCHVAIWNESFALLGKSDAKTIWGNFMQHLTKTASGPFILGCRGCGRVSFDEYALLECIAGHQNNNADMIQNSLKRWFKGDALIKADAITEIFADQLSVQGFCIQSDTEKTLKYDLVSADMAPTTRMN